MALLAMAASGCASVDWASENWAAMRNDDVASRRKQRLIEAAERFDEKREKAQWQAALARMRNGNWDGARDQLEALLARNPDHADAREILGKIDASRSTSAAAQTESLAPSLHRGTAFGAPDDINDPQAAVSLAVDALQSNQPDVALGVLRPALVQFPESAALWRTLGVAHHQQGDFQSAQSALRQALSLDNSSPLAYFLLGQSLQSLGQYEQAERHFQAAADLDGRYAM